MIPSIDLSLGGPSVVARELNRAFRGLGHDARIVTIGHPDPGCDEADFPQVRYCRPTGPASLEISLALSCTVIRLARSADIIAMDGFYGAHAAACYLASRLFDKPIVVQPHGVFDRHQRTQSRTMKLAFDAIVGHRLLSRASAIHFSSGLERESFDPATTRARLAVVPHGSQLPAPEPAEPIAQWLAAGRYSKIFCFVGRLAAKKQPDLLIRAWSRIDTPADSCLVVAGSEADWTVRQLRELAAAGGAQNVFIDGHLERQQVTWLLQRSGVFVLPSWEENFGLTVVEAISESCYVITTTAVGAASFVQDGRSGRVLDSPTVDSLARELRRVLDQWWRVDKLSADSSSDVPGRIPLVTWDHSARALVALYTQILDSAGQRDQ